jgi:hypothetical protein
LIYVSAILIALSLPNVSVQLAEAQNAPAASAQHTPTQMHALKVTLLSTMLVGGTTGLGEWGFSALIEADGHRVLLDTGAHPDTVLQNVHDLKNEWEALGPFPRSPNPPTPSLPDSLV